MKRVFLSPLSMLLLALSWCRLPGAESPVLPPPSGPHPVGTLTIHLVEVSRSNPGAMPDSDGRDVNVQFWYPAHPVGMEKAAPYLPDLRLRDVVQSEGFYDQDKDVLAALASVPTHALIDAEVSPSDALRPLLVLSHGFGMPRWMNTASSEELASQGYVIAAIDHPAGGLTMLPDGRVLTSEDDPALATGDGFAQRVEDWAADAIFVLDRLSTPHPQGAGLKKLSAQLELSRVGMFGHSMGGLAALRACCLDDRFVAAANLDGGPLGEIQESGTCAPSLHLCSGPDYSDEDLAKRGRTREQWDEMGRMHEEMWTEWMGKSRARFDRVTLRGAGHMSFSDAPYVMPDLITRFGGRIIDTDRGHRIVSEMLRSFFDRTFHGRESRPIEALAREFEELMVTTHIP